MVKKLTIWRGIMREIKKTGDSDKAKEYNASWRTCLVGEFVKKNQPRSFGKFSSGDIIPKAEDILNDFYKSLYMKNINLLEKSIKRMEKLKKAVVIRMV